MVRLNIYAEPLHTAAFVGIVGIAKIGGGEYGLRHSVLNTEIAV